ncbi:MAG: PTS sugar transporter subunit IIA [Clostridia bacterium]|jgi:PTS system galactitol-specific IIA component|nr:PTS sugar transporter subunit IIA [Clostridia bacterium]
MAGIQLHTDADLVEVSLEAETSEQVIRELGKRVLAKGYIDEEFIENLLAREKEFPTGLETVYPIAIPHVGGHCHKSFLAVAVLKKPVTFMAMEGTGKELDVRCVFLFGITDPQHQVEVLKKFIFAFREEENLKKIHEATEKNEILNILKTLLDDGLVVDNVVKEAKC